MIMAWIARNVGWVFLALWIGMVAILAMQVMTRHGVSRDFMTGCLQDRKEYECIAIWRHGLSSANPPAKPMVQP